MKRNWNNKKQMLTVITKVPGALPVMIIAMVVLLSCRKDTASDSIYTCPMHPTVVSHKPGACPVCNMELVKKVEGAAIDIDPSLAAAATPPNEKIRSSIKTVRGNFTALPVVIARQGIVTYDPRNRATVSARVAGRVEKSFVKTLYQRVRKGDKIAEIYSPELITAQKEWLLALDTDPDNQSLLAAAKKRLLLLGMTERQIATVGQSREAMEVIAIYSSASGIVIPRGGQAPTAPLPPTGGISAMDDMNTRPGATRPGNATIPNTASANAAVGATTSGGDLLREGSYVSSGQTMFEVVDVSRVRVEVNVPATVTGNVRAGDELVIQANDKNITTIVDMVQPFSTDGNPFIKVRADVQNGNLLFVGQLVTATLHLPPVEGLWLPVESVLDLGMRKVVFVKHGDYFEPAEVITGISATEQIMVISGIASGDEIAANAQFLVDNEGFIKTR